MFMFSAVSIAIFYNGDAQSMEADFNYLNSPIRYLTKSTLGNMGEPTSFCYRVGSGASVDISCGNNRKIKAITAYYGNPRGACSCPSLQLPSGDGSCPGHIVSETDKHIKVCSSNVHGVPQACYPSYFKLPIHDAHQPCCANSTTSDGSPAVGTAGAFDPNYSCNSASAQPIAEALCLNQVSCQLQAQGSYVYKWAQSSPSSFAGVYCVGSPSPYGLNKYECQASFGSQGAWTSCRDDAARYLVVQVCLDYILVVDDY